MPWKSTEREGYPAYPVPENPFPENRICVRVFLPDDPIYLADWWNSWAILGKWVAWPRDAQHTAKDIAAFWQECIDLTRSL